MEPDFPPVARLVVDCLRAVAADQYLQDALAFDEIQPGWIVSGLWQVLSDAAVPVSLSEVLTCNYPLAQYFQNHNLPDVNYRNSLYLQADGWLFDTEDRWSPPEQKGWGFTACADDTVVFRRERDRWNEPGRVWHQGRRANQGTPYVEQNTYERVRALAAAPLAAYQQQALDQSTPAARAPRAGPRL